jgi:hypothetical protein
MTLATYTDHPVRDALKQLLDLQGRPEFADLLIAENEQYAFSRDKVFAIAHLLHGLLEQTPATTASFSALASIQANLQPPYNELNAFVSDKNPAHLVTAAAQFEQSVLPLFWGLPGHIAATAGQSLNAIVQKPAEMAAETIHQLAKQRDQFSKTLTEAITDADLLSARLETMQEAASKERAEATAAVANLQKLYAEKEIERNTAFEATVSGFKNTFETFQSGTTTKGTDLIAAIEVQKADAARIVQVVGNIGVTGNYQQIANKEGVAANFWRWVTLGIFAAGITVAVATFVKFWDLPMSPENLWSVVVLLLYAIAITTPAWYTASESARHRTNADRARQTELELASIGPFIELMPEDKKVEIRESLTKSYFGKTVDEHFVKSPFDVANLKEVVELVKAIKK